MPAEPGSLKNRGHAGGAGTFRSSEWTPLVQPVCKPAPRSRDKVRLLGSHLAPRDFATTNQNDTLTPTGNERTTVRSSGPSYVNWQLRLELKL